jgi:phosphoglycerate-specific signal transduction histidine kinase
MIDERLKQIADHYGLDEQLNMLQEECAELIQAVSKYRRTGKTSNLYEEITDVKILLQQIDYLLDKEFSPLGVMSQNAYNYFSGIKIKRQLERIQNESELGHKDS